MEFFLNSIINKMGFILLIGKREDRFICHEQNDIFFKKEQIVDNTTSISVPSCNNQELCETRDDFSRTT